MNMNFDYSLSDSVNRSPRREENINYSPLRNDYRTYTQRSYNDWRNSINRSIHRTYYEHSPYYLELENDELARSLNEEKRMNRELLNVVNANKYEIDSLSRRVEDKTFEFNDLIYKLEQSERIRAQQSDLIVSLESELRQLKIKLNACETMKKQDDFNSERPKNNMNETSGNPFLNNKAQNQNKDTNLKSNEKTNASSNMNSNKTKSNMNSSNISKTKSNSNLKGNVTKKTK